MLGQLFCNLASLLNDNSPLAQIVDLLYKRRLSLHHFYKASIRKACVHTLSTGCGEKNDAKLTAVCIRPNTRNTSGTLIDTPRHVVADAGYHASATAGVCASRAGVTAQ